MSEMVERVKTAIFDAYSEHYVPCMDREASWDLAIARKVIEAMRMPEAAQLAAARPYTGDGGLAWRAMIDAALKD
jgi:hypothetical protein